LRISAGVFGRLVLVVFLLTIASCRKHQEQSADATAKKGPLQKWAFSTGAQALRWQLDLPAQIVGSPVVDAKGNVFISTTTQLMAVSSDGTVSWKTKLNDRCASSPALTEDGTLYVGLDSNQLIAVDADGKQKWSLRTRGIVRWPPVISTDGTIYAATDGGEVIALQDAGSPLMRNAWPRYQHDSQNTGRIADF
jgi:outer membrane protein assembly factor BamB